MHAADDYGYIAARLKAIETANDPYKCECCKKTGWMVKMIGYGSHWVVCDVCENPLGKPQPQ